MSQSYFYPPAASANANASVGLNGVTAPTSSTEIGFIGSTGLETPVSSTNPLPVSLTSPLIVGENLAQVNGNTVATGVGASNSGTQRVAVSSDSSLASIGSITSPLPAGTNALGTVGVTALPSIPAGSNAIGSVSVSNFPATQPVSGTVAVSNFPSEQAVNLNQVGGSSIAIGQQLSAASLPVVLPAAQITSLTPPTTVTVIQPTGSNLHVDVDNFPATQAISAVSLPLPSGAATDAHLTNVQSAPGTSQTTALTIQGNASAIPVPVSGTVSVTFPSEQAVNLNQVGGSSIAIGQQLSAASLPVVLPAAQISTLTPLSTVTVTQATGTNLHTVVDSSALPSGASTAALQSNVQSAPGTSQTVAITVQGNASGIPIPVTSSAASLPSAPVFGHATSSGTATVLGSSASLLNGVIIQALATNAGNVYVGSSAVTTSTGFQLQPGQATSVAVNNLNVMYVIAATSGDGVCYIGS